jgi:hypothetical protein
VTRVGLVACSAGKLDRPAPARELYTSQLFCKARLYVETHCDRWYVLSARHGLVAPERVLAPYDERLGANTADWCWLVRSQLCAELTFVHGVELVVLAGENYRGFLDGSPWPVKVPMEGLGIGQQLGWLTRAVA